jgi:capsular polysaccharide biosynthesis protein
MDYIDIDRESRTLRLRDLIDLIQIHWRAIIASTLLCTLIAVGWTMLQPTKYSSTATGLVIATGERDLISALSGDDLAQSRAVSYESLATSRRVAETVIEQLDLDTIPERLLSQVVADVPVNTTEIQVTAEAGSPMEAADLANAWIVALAEQVQLVEVIGNDPDAVGGVLLQPMNNASVPLGPSSPILKLNLAIGALAGLGLGLLYAFARYKLDRRIRSVEEIQELFGVPVLGVIPTDERLVDHPDIIETGFSGGRGAQAYSEALRKLRTHLSFASVDPAPRTVVVTSYGPGEGKSSITANLAVAIASTGRKVIVVDGDLRRPVVT